jgi:hypothetical protein
LVEQDWQRFAVSSAPKAPDSVRRDPRDAKCSST